MTAQPIESAFSETAREAFGKLAALMQQGIPKHCRGLPYGSLVQETPGPVQVPIDEVKIGNVRGTALSVRPYLDREGLRSVHGYVTRLVAQTLDVDLRAHVVMHPKVERLHFAHGNLRPFDGDLNALSEAFDEGNYRMEDALWEALGAGSTVRADWELKHFLEMQRALTRGIHPDRPLPFQVDSLPLRFNPDCKPSDGGLPEFIEPLTDHPVEGGVRTTRNPRWQSAPFGVAILAKAQPVWRLSKGVENERTFLAERSSLEDGLEVEFAVVNGVGKFFWQSVRSYHLHAPQDVKVIFYRRPTP
jgi:hypothetical protein